MALKKRKKKLLTDYIFFDTDCLSSFLWVNNQNFLVKLYSGRIYIPMQVYNELSNPCVLHLKAKIDDILSKNHAKQISINTGTTEYSLYYQLTEKPAKGKYAIGKGEASALVLAKKYNGTIASNNLSDISTYIYDFDIKHLTTADILYDAFMSDYITEDEGNKIWNAMQKKRFKLGGLSFTEHINNQRITNT